MVVIKFEINRNCFGDVYSLREGRFFRGLFASPLEAIGMMLVGYVFKL